MMYRIGLCLSLVMLAWACNDDAAVERQALDYFPLEIGNYWAYDLVVRDTLGIEKPLRSGRDTIFVVGDTLIDNVRFFLLENRDDVFADITPTMMAFVQNGIVTSPQSTGRYLSASDDDTIHRRTFLEAPPDPFTLTAVYVMQTEDLPMVATDAGTFSDLLLKQRIYTTSESNYRHGNPRVANVFFARDVGIAEEEVFYYNSANLMIRRLDAFHLE